MTVLIPFTAIAFWTVIGILAAGLASMVTARLAEGSPKQSRYQVLFVVSLLTVAASTLIAMTLSNELFLACGATLSIMAVGATLDLRARASTDF